MKQITINSQTDVRSLKKQFKSVTGGTLRVYQGTRVLDDSTPLKRIPGARIPKGGTFQFDEDATVGNFREKFREELGINVKVASPDNWVVVLEEFPISRICGIPRNAVIESMKRMLGKDWKPLSSHPAKKSSPADPNGDRAMEDDGKTPQNHHQETGRTGGIAPGRKIKLFASKEEMERVLYQYEHALAYSHYGVEKNAIDKAIDHFPQNTEVGSVLIKCLLINGFYSTSIMEKDLSGIATRLVEDYPNFDEMLESGNLEAVEIIKEISFEVTGSTYYSFATKYCSFHNQEKFPIYDSFVGTALRYEFPELNDKKYPDFKDAIDRLALKIGGCSYYDLDHYLWIRGKEMFDLGFRDGIEYKLNGTNPKCSTDFPDYKSGFRRGLKADAKSRQRYLDGYNGRKGKPGIGGKDGKVYDGNQWPGTEYSEYQIGWKAKWGQIAVLKEDGIHFEPASHTHKANP